ncbi:hypothetical protein F4604DRAFT_1929959 [Suillus subluteus]|nr:hypothetical protein F4604DRAFT_1929959 [Suillus subluteus]
MPPPQRIKDFVKDLGNLVLAVRLTRPKKNGLRQRSSTTTDHDSDGSIHAQFPSAYSFPSSTLSSNSSLAHSASSREPSPESSANVPPARHSRALPSVQAVASAIPLIGAPMQAAISGLLTGLQAIDRRNQNQADLNSLILRLDRLSRKLCNASPASDRVEQSRRDSFDTSAQVTTLRERCLASTSVTQAIAECFVKIDRYLAEYLVVFYSLTNVCITLTILFGYKGTGGSSELIDDGRKPGHPQALRGRLIDATGHRHSISVNFCTSFEQFNSMLKVLFKCNSIEARIQRRYIESEQYDLSIDEGTQVTQLASNE